MVRLKEGIKDEVNNVTGRFQFQYGSIKSVFFLSASYRSSRFQFQYGSIKSFMQTYPTGTIDGISIPIWFD